MTSVTQTPAWKALEEHKKALQNTQMKELFASDPERFNKFHATFNDIHYYYYLFNQKRKEFKKI